MSEGASYLKPASAIACLSAAGKREVEQCQVSEKAHNGKQVSEKARDDSLDKRTCMTDSAWV